jgi:hypothetical protein
MSQRVARFYAWISPPYGPPLVPKARSNPEKAEKMRCFFIF